MNSNSNIKYWFPVILWICFIFWMSTAMFGAQNTSSFLEPILRYLFPSFSHKEIEHWHFVIRKMAHFTEYFITGFLLFRAFRSGSKEHYTWRWIWYSCAVVAIIAATDEYHQVFVPNRTPSIIDVGIDISGGMFALLVTVIKQKYSKEDE